MVRLRQTSTIPQKASSVVFSVLVRKRWTWSEVETFVTDLYLDLVLLKVEAATFLTLSLLPHTVSSLGPHRTGGGLQGHEGGPSYARIMRREAGGLGGRDISVTRSSFGRLWLSPRMRKSSPDHSPPAPPPPPTTRTRGLAIFSSCMPSLKLQQPSAVAGLGGDPGVQRNPPFLAKMNLAHGGVCSLSNRRRRYYYNNVCREARRSIFRRGSSTLRGEFAPRRNSSRMISTQALCMSTC